MGRAALLSRYIGLPGLLLLAGLVAIACSGAADQGVPQEETTPEISQRGVPQEKVTQEASQQGDSQGLAWDNVEKARKYAPALRFDVTAPWYPVAFDYDGNWWGLDNNEYWGEGLGRDASLGDGAINETVGQEDEWYDGGDDGRSSEVGYGRFDQHRWMDEDGRTLGQLAGADAQERWGRGDAPPLTAYYKVIEGNDHVVYEYWFYYVYNTVFWFSSLSQSGKITRHEHDWESVFVWVDKATGEPYHLRVSNFKASPEYSIYDRSYQSESDGIYVGLDGQGTEGHGMALTLSDLVRPADGYMDGRRVSPGEWDLIDIDSSGLYLHSGAAYDVDGVTLDGDDPDCGPDPEHPELCLLDAFAAGYGALSASPTAAYDAGYTGLGIGVDGISTSPGLSYGSGDFINHYSFNQIDYFEDGTWRMRSEGPDDMKANGFVENDSDAVVPPWSLVEYWHPDEIDPPPAPVSAPGILWARQFGTPESDEALDVAVDSVGGVYVVGYTLGTIPGQAGLGDRDAYIRKYDSDGNELWTRQFGSEDFDSAHGVTVGPADNVYVVGNTWGVLPGQTGRGGGGDGFLRKYGSRGNELWTRQFGTEESDQAVNVAVDGTGDIYVAGSTRGAFTGQVNLGRSDAYVRKYDGDGNVLGTRQFGTGHSDEALSVAVDSAGGLYVTGGTWSRFPDQTKAGGRDSFLRVYDKFGSELWTRQFGTSGWDEAKGVASDNAGNVYVVGDTSEALPGQTNRGTYDAYLRKYAGDGSELWTGQFGSRRFDLAWDVAVDGTDSLYIAGWTQGALPGRSSLGRFDAFVRRYDGDGRELWTNQFGTEEDEVASDLAIDGAGNLYAVGYTKGSLPGQTGYGGLDAYVVKIAVGIPGRPQSGIQDASGDGEAQ